MAEGTVGKAGFEPASLMLTITVRYCQQPITHHALPLGDIPVCEILTHLMLPVWLGVCRDI